MRAAARPDALSLETVIGNGFLDPLRRRLQINGCQQHDAGDDDQRGKHEADTNKPGHRDRTSSVEEQEWVSLCLDP